MLISVIIPTYNREKTLMRAMRSVLDQTYRELELIIVDDCSTDGTAELVRGVADKRVRYLCLDHNQGACAARNKGIEEARGEYIAFQDSDDLWLPNKLERQLQIMNEQGAKISFHRLRQCYRNGITTGFPADQESCFLDHRQICSRFPMVSTQTIMARRELFLKHRFDPLVVKGQDYDWAIRASTDDPLYYIGEILCDQYLQQDSITAKGYQGMLDSREYFLQKYSKEVQENPEFEVIQLHTIVKAKAMLGQNCTKECKRIFTLSKTPRNCIFLVLSRIGLLGRVYRLHEKKKGNTELP